jgi:hypothetical protein
MVDGPTFPCLSLLMVIGVGKIAWRDGFFTLLVALHPRLLLLLGNLVKDKLPIVDQFASLWFCFGNIGSVPRGEAVSAIWFGILTKGDFIRVRSSVVLSLTDHTFSKLTRTANAFGIHLNLTCFGGNCLLLDTNGGRLARRENLVEKLLNLGFLFVWLLLGLELLLYDLIGVYNLVFRPLVVILHYVIILILVIVSRTPLGCGLICLLGIKFSRLLSCF